MATLAVIEAKVELAQAYYLQQIALDVVELKRCGRSPKTALLTCLNRLLRALAWDVADQVDDATTQDLYQKLSIAIAAYSGATLPFEPNVYIPGSTIVLSVGTIMQTGVVFPGDGSNSYTFAELIDQTVLTVYRGTGTTLRAHPSAADNEYAQFNPVTGLITVNYAFSAGESLWVEYRTTT